MDRIEANLNIHLQSYAKNIGRIQDDFSRVVEKINTCDDRVDVHQQRHVDQESFTLGEKGQLTGGYMLITLWFLKQFVHNFSRGDMLITF